MSNKYEDVLVSVIMSTYNSAKYLPETINSILWQTHQNLEFIIIDDCSTDNTEEIVKSYNDSRIVYIKNDERKGPYVNLKRAQLMAKGDYIAQMDSDDISIPTRIEKQLIYLKENDCMLAGGRAQQFGLRHGFIDSTGDGRIMRVYLLGSSALPHPTLMYSRVVVDEGITYNENRRYADDYEFQFLIANKYRVGGIEKALLMYRMHEEQITTDKRELQRASAAEIREMIFNELGINLTKDEMSLWNDIFDETKPRIDDISNPAKKSLSALNKILDFIKSDDRYDSAYGYEFVKSNGRKLAHKLNIIERHKLLIGLRKL